MILKTLGPKAAAQLDQELMSSSTSTGGGGFALEQLMELAGLSVAEAAYKVHPVSKGRNILIACGPGNNGGDGLVAARHLHHFGYKPKIYYPKPSKPDIFVGLQRQLRNLNIPFIDDFHAELSQTSLIIDAIFGFSFKGPPREPFSAVIQALEEGSGQKAKDFPPVLAVDAPSSWDIDGGPPSEGPGAKYMPEYLISLTAAKPLVKWFKGQRHFIGGRFLSEEVAHKYDLDVPEYQGVDQIAEVPIGVEVAIAGGEKL